MKDSPDIEIAKRRLREKTLSFVLVKEGTILYETAEKGILPLLRLTEQGMLKGASIADKIVGKAAAQLMCCGGIKEVYGETLSQDGKQVLQQEKIPFTYHHLVEMILNRTETDRCPMEKLVQKTTSPPEGFLILRDFWKEKAPAPMKTIDI